MTNKNKNTKETPSKPRSIRFRDALWSQIKEDAERRGIKTSNVVVSIMDAHYNSEGSSNSESIDAIVGAVEVLAEQGSSQQETLDLLPKLLEEYTAAFAGLTGQMKQLLTGAEVIVVEESTVVTN